MCPSGQAPIVPRPAQAGAYTRYCYKLPTPLPHCQYHASATVCLYCVQGYLLSGGLCVTAVSIPDCLVITTRFCASCPAGYRLLTPVDDGKSISYGLSLATTFQTTVELESRCVLDLPNTFANPQAPIVPSQIPHCATYSNAGTCLRCEPQYFIDAVGLCVKSIATVPYCLVYAAEGVCQVCTDQRFPTDGGRACTPVANDIEHCKCYYSYDVCNYCEKDFYLSDGVCKKVTFLKGNCDIYGANQ